MKIDKVFLFVEGYDCNSVNPMRYVKLNSYDVRTGKMGLREVNDFRLVAKRHFEIA